MDAQCIEIHPLRAWRQKHKVQQWKLAEMAGVTQSMICKIEIRAHPPSLALTRRLCEITKLKAEKFF